MEVSANASGRICILTDALYMNVYQAREKKGWGLKQKTLSAPGGELVVFVMR